MADRMVLANPRRWRAWGTGGLLLACLLAPDAWGLALGPAQLQSALGEPLRVSIELPALSAEEAETLQVSLADPAAFQAAGLEYKPLLASLVLQLESSPDGQTRLRLQGRQSVNEAFVDLLLQARWKGGQLTRQYRLLLSPAGSTVYPSGPQVVASSAPVDSTRAGGIALPPARPETGGTTMTVRKSVGAPEPSSSPTASEARKPAPPPFKSTLPPAPGTMAPPATSPSTPVEVTSGQDRPAEPAAGPATEPPAAEPASSPAAPTAVAPVALAPAAPVEPPWQERMLQPVWLAAAALLLAGLAGLLIWQRRRQSSFKTLPPLAGSQTTVTAGSVSAVAASAAALPASAIVASGSAEAIGSEVDAIAEADVYLAYGRIEQAEEILREALRQNPAELELHLKLLEITVQRGDRPASEQLLSMISGLTGQAGAEWEQAEALMRLLPPELPATVTAEPAPLPGLAAADQPPPPPIEISLPPVAPTAPPNEPAAKAAAPDEPPAKAQDQGLDFEFDLSLPATPVAAAPQSAPQVQEPRPDEDRGLDFELDLSEIGRKPAQPAADATPSTTPPKAAMDLGLDFDTPQGIAADELTGKLIQEDNSEPDPLATQLELAEEFLALGDAEGARPLAERVQALATGELQSRARALLQQIDARPH